MKHLQQSAYRSTTTTNYLTKVTTTTISLKGTSTAIIIAVKWKLA